MSKAVFIYFKYRTTLLVDRHKGQFDFYICIYTVMAKNIGTLGKYDQKRL